MNNQLNNFIQSKKATEMATKKGSIIHAKLQFVRIGVHPVGDAYFVAKIMQSSQELQSFFTDASKTEVPIAGVVNDVFISRRIDRLVIDEETKTIKILDYKTDLDSSKFHLKYIEQLHEYRVLLKQIYPDYKISCYILWTHNWMLEKL